MKQFTKEEIENIHKIQERDKDKYQPRESYRVRGFRLHDETWEKLKQKRGSVSWNKFLLELVNK